jgi:hypothetical protein
MRRIPRMRRWVVTQTLAVDMTQQRSALGAASRVAASAIFPGREGAAIRLRAGGAAGRPDKVLVRCIGRSGSSLGQVLFDHLDHAVCCGARRKETQYWAEFAGRILCSPAMMEMASPAAKSAHVQWRTSRASSGPCDSAHGLSCCRYRGVARPVESRSDRNGPIADLNRRA